MDLLEQFARFADVLPEAMMLVDGAGTVLAVNRRFPALLGGRPPSDFIGRRLDTVTLGRADATAAWLRACSRSRDLMPGALGFHDQRGERVDCKAAGAAFRAATDQAPAVVLVRLLPKARRLDPFVALNLRIEELSAQVSRRRRAEEALYAERELLQITLSSIGDAVITTDQAARVTFMNPVAQALTGWSDAEARSRPLNEVFVIVNEYTRAKVDNPVTKVLREGAIVGLANHTILINRDGTEFAIDDSAAPIRGETQALVGTVLVFHDVSERRSIERELEARARELLDADRRKDEFLAMLAHELRNPMAPITNVVALLEAKLGNIEPVRDLLEILKRQTGTLRTLVDDLLDVSRITRGLVELKRQRVSLASVIDGALETVQSVFDQNQQRTSVTRPDVPVDVIGDPVRLEQVLVNLLTNAAKFTQTGGQILIHLERHDPMAVVRVRDNGIGIAPDVLGDVFTLFRQSDAGLDRSRGGLGVGLTISKNLVDLHGGSIEARSDGIGAGSEFVIRLPMAPPAEQQDQLQAGQPTSVVGRRILVVDDNVDAADTLALVLNALGHDVTVAYGGPQALEKADELAPEYIVLDIGLPEMDGYEVVRRLRQNPRTRAAAIAALTGYGQQSDRARTRAAGFDAHFVKPVDVDKITSFLSGRSHEQDDE